MAGAGLHRRSLIVILAGFGTWNHALITSTRNPKIQWVRAIQLQPKTRRDAGVFLVEGIRLLEEAYQHGWSPELVLFVEGIGDRGLELVNRYRDRGIQVEQVAPHVLKAAAETESPQGVLAVLPIIELPFPTSPTLILIVDSLRDPGNLGTILRTAAAAAVEAVVLAPASVDPFSPKVVRAGMGAHFHLPIRSFGWAEIRDYAKTGSLDGPLKVYLADANSGLPYTLADFQSPFALVIGGEAEGASQEARRWSDERVHIPLPGQSESLNAGIAAGILLFEAVRQRNPSRSL